MAPIYRHIEVAENITFIGGIGRDVIDEENQEAQCSLSWLIQIFRGNVQAEPVNPIHIESRLWNAVNGLDGSEDRLQSFTVGIPESVQEDEISFEDQSIDISTSSAIPIFEWFGRPQIYSHLNRDKPFDSFTEFIMDHHSLVIDKLTACRALLLFVKNVHHDAVDSNGYTPKKREYYPQKWMTDWIGRVPKEDAFKMYGLSGQNRKLLSAYIRYVLEFMPVIGSYDNRETFQTSECFQSILKFLILMKL